MELLETILEKMSKVSKAQKRFIIEVITVLQFLPGRATYRNLSRYSYLHEKTYSRWFKRDFDFLQLNSLALEEYVNKKDLLAIIDCSFVNKSGQKTDGLDKFYNGKASKTEKGLEISTLAVVDTTYNTAYNLSTRQTPRLENPQETRIDWYLKHFATDCYQLPQSVKYLVTDGYYSKKKFTNGIVKLNYHQVGKLRHDANLRYLYTGEHKAGPGRKKQYDGKVNFNDVNRFEQIKIDNKLSIYTAIVNSITLKSNIRIAYLVKKIGKKLQTALFFSTDIDLSALKIYSFYKSRFQIEFLFRDAKQFMGLTHCQARSQQALNFHFNVTMTTLNFIKFQHFKSDPHLLHKPLSISSWKTRYFNQHLLLRFSRILGFDLSSNKYKSAYQSLRDYGVIHI